MHRKRKRVRHRAVHDCLRSFIRVETDHGVHAVEERCVALQCRLEGGAHDDELAAQRRLEIAPRWRVQHARGVVHRAADNGPRINQHAAQPLRSEALAERTLPAADVDDRRGRCCVRRAVGRR